MAGQATDGIRRAGWALLGALGLALFAAAWVHDRSDWPGRLAGESTYLMQARSLAEDFDLVYTRADFDRTLLSDLENPTDLDLVSTTGGRRIAYDRPFPYALVLAPFVKLWPQQGFAIVNAILLILASVFAARTLERGAGSWSALCVSFLLFGSVAFAYVFTATGDLFLFVVTLMAFCLAASSTDTDGAATTARTWTWVGILLAIPVATEALYLVLPVAAILCFGRDVAGADRRAVLRAFLVGFVPSLALIAVAGWWAGGSLLIFGGSEFRFTPQTGYPLVDFTAAEWTQTVRRFSALYWEGAPRFSWGVDPRLWMWDMVDLVAGRSIGLLPYFAPLVLLAASASSRRRLLAGMALAWAVGIVVLQPFNIYGGEGAVGNRLFLPIYAALWLLVPTVSRWSIGAVAVGAGLAAVFMVPLWSSPGGYPIVEQDGYRHVSQMARRVLPFETGQYAMPASSLADHNSLRIRFLSPGGWAEEQRGRLLIDSQSVEMLIASPVELDRLRFDFGKDAPSQMLFGRGEVAETVLAPGGGISFRVRPTSRPRRHALWWTPEPQWLYRLTVELPEAPERGLAFVLHGEHFEDS